MGKHYGLSLVLAVDDEGRLTKITPWVGVYVKADPLIIAELRQRNCFSGGKSTHRYPFVIGVRHLWYSAESWFVDVQS
jgi:isoleucyl-tRNA synthetase